MFSYDFDKILDLIKKTGDRMIVVPEFSEPYVVMNVAEYEKLLDKKKKIEELNEQELWDEIDRDIALWKESHRDEEESEDEWMPEPEWSKPSWMREPSEDEPLVKPFEFENDNLSKSEEEIEEEKTLDENLDEESFDNWNFPSEENEPVSEQKPEQKNEERPEKISRNKFAIPQERLRQSWNLESLENNEEEPTKIKYENIPPPPDLNFNNGLVESEKPKVVDLSWDDDDDVVLGEDMNDKKQNF